MRRAIALFAASLMLATSGTGCIGQMATSGKVMEFNLNAVENRFARWILFLVLYVIPVYPIAGMLDLIIVNSLEFWTGTNPITNEARIARAGDTKTVEGADGTVATSTLMPDGSINIDVVQPNGDTHHLNLQRDGAYVVARDAELEPVARMDMNGLVQSVKPRLAEAQ